MPDVAVRVGFLKKLHLFSGLSDDQLKSVAGEMDEQTFDEPATVFLEGTPADAFYIVFSGRVTIWRKNKDKEIKLATLVTGDYFGEQALLTKRTHNATVKAEKGAVLLKLYHSKFKGLLTKVPNLRPNFHVMIDSRRLARELHFPWLATDEVIYFLARKHPFLLVQAMIAPAGVVLLSVIFAAVAIIVPSIAFATISGFVLVLALAWGTWRWVDWGNDYYIVTNQRVVWIEKVVMLYDSRSEAPMTTILSVSTEMDYWGRQLDYGTVVVRTFTGQIRMEFVRHPKQAASMIEEYWNRTKERAKQMDEDIIKNAIRNKLGIKPPGGAPPPPPPPKPAPPPKKETLIDAIVAFFRDSFQMRVEASGTVTYRKHWFVLLRDTWRQIGLLIGLILVPVIYSLVVDTPPFWLLFFVSLAVVGDIGWWFYGFVDWKNDLYQVTSDQIIDVYREPFGKEDRKAAPIDGILSTEYKRDGFIGMLFNYGTVYITVGGAKFDFEDVFDPPSVQQDIVRRVQAKMQKKRESEGAAERDRMAQWLAYYYKTMQDIEREQKQARSGNPE